MTFTMLLFLLVALFLPHCNASDVKQADTKCDDALDIVHVQDVTAAFDPFWPKVTTNLEKAIQMIKDSGVDVNFGVATFGDKNVATSNQEAKESYILGAKNDYCLHVNSPLQEPNATKVMNLFNAHSKKATSEGDPPGGVFEALYRALAAQSLRWRRNTHNSHRIVVVVTGTTSHLQGDVEKLTGVKLRPFDITSGTMLANYDCDKVEYPTVEQVASYIRQDEHTHVVILVAPGGTTDSEGNLQLYNTVTGLEPEYHSPDGLYRWYRSKFQKASPETLIVYMDNENRYLEVFEQILESFRAVKCSRGLE